MIFLLTPFIYITTIWTLLKEKKVLKTGRSLNSKEKEIGEILKINDLTKIRILAASEITHPLSWVFSFLSLFTKSILSAPVGLTLGNAILVEKKHETNLHLIAHELVHVKQYEDLGGHIPFLKKYIYQCLKYGYKNSPLEMEAEEFSNNLFNQGLV